MSTYALVTPHVDHVDSFFWLTPSPQKLSILTSFCPIRTALTFGAISDTPILSLSNCTTWEAGAILIAFWYVFFYTTTLSWISHLSYVHLCISYTTRKSLHGFFLTHTLSLEIISFDINNSDTPI